MGDQMEISIYSFLVICFTCGCPGRQLFLTGEGDGDAAIFVLGMVAGAAFAHNFGPAGSPKGIGLYAIPAVVTGLLACLFIGFITMKERTQ